MPATDILISKLMSRKQKTIEEWDKLYIYYKAFKIWCRNFKNINKNCLQRALYIVQSYGKGNKSSFSARSLWNQCKIWSKCLPLVVQRWLKRKTKFNITPCSLRFMGVYAAQLASSSLSSLEGLFWYTAEAPTSKNVWGGPNGNCHYMYVCMHMYAYVYIDIYVSNIQIIKVFGGARPP